MIPLGWVRQWGGRSVPESENDRRQAWLLSACVSVCVWGRGRGGRNIDEYTISLKSN